MENTNNLPYYVIGTDTPNREYWYIPALGKFVKEEDDISLEYQDERMIDESMTYKGHQLHTVEDIIKEAKEIGLYDITVIYQDGTRNKITIEETEQ